ncbi:dienelactone hydrolase family protein [Pseudonocardia kongjuensis]|uniref:Dienelactone hydrolase family protein n=1 Tax=Pseudonocardia kongjuensis TaxID=102227 RepID=A0ABN1Y2D8_9PSEU
MLRWGDPAAPVTVLALHGRDRDPADMRATASRFGPVPARFAAPRAPGGSWYPKPFLEPFEENRAALQAALDVVDDRLDRLAAEGHDRDRVVLWGFSQGACLAAHHVLARRTAPLAGLVLFTGGFVGPDPLPAPPPGSLAGTPAVLRSIADDPWVPRRRVEQTAALLTAAGAEVDLRIEPGDEHVITDEACSAAAALLRALAVGGGL